MDTVVYCPSDYGDYGHCALEVPRAIAISATRTRTPHLAHRHKASALAAAAIADPRAHSRPTGPPISRCRFRLPLSTGAHRGPRNHAGRSELGGQRVTTQQPEPGHSHRTPALHLRPRHLPEFSAAGADLSRAFPSTINPARVRWAAGFFRFTLHLVRKLGQRSTHPQVSHMTSLAPDRRPPPRHLHFPHETTRMFHPPTFRFIPVSTPHIYAIYAHYAHFPG